MLAEIPPDKFDKLTWNVWGGHRLWHAPENQPRTYSPDNDPVAHEPVGKNGIHLTQKPEPSTGIQKDMIVSLAASGTEITIQHKLTNKSMWSVELAPWALTVVRGGGEEFIPNEPFIPHGEKLLPARPLVMWNYTDLSDSRLTLGKKYIRLRTNDKIDEANKIGVLNTQGWTAYLLDGNLFVKRYGFEVKAVYPDMGCNYETFTKNSFMELESLGPLAKLEPGESVEHMERWYLFKDINLNGTDNEVDAILTPLIKKTKEAAL